MRITAAVIIVLITFGNPNVMAADYSVGVEGTTILGGAGLDLYTITGKELSLVGGGPFVLQQNDWTGHLASILALSVDPKHDFVYVAYTGTTALSNTQPIIVGFQISATGLSEQWEIALETGSATLAGTTIRAVDNYLIEYTYPAAGPLFVSVISQSGEPLVYDEGTSADGTYGDVVSGHIDQNGRFYYSCRGLPGSGPGHMGVANSVAVYDLRTTAPIGHTSGTLPTFSSTDAVFVQSICGGAFP